jgi:hypothetical protein
MKKILTILMLLVSASTWADRVYVATTGNDGTGNGTSGAPYLTIPVGISHASAGDTVFVVAGTYTINAQLNLPVGVSLMGEGDNSILLGNYYTASESYGIVSLYSYPSQGVNGNQSVSFLQLNGQGETAYAAIVVFGRSNVKIHDLNIHDFTAIGIYLRGGCVRSGGYEGNVGAAPSTYETGNEIYNCILTNNGNNIQLNSQSDPIVHDNIITETKSHSPGVYGHIVAGWGEWFKGLKFYNNTCRKPLIDPDGNWNFHFEVGTTHGGNEVYNNVFYNGTALDIASWENLRGDYDYSWWIHHNTFKLDRQLALSEEPHPSIAIDFEATNEYAIVEHNVFENYPYGVALDIAQSPRFINDIRIRYNQFRNMGYSNDVYSFVFNLASYYEPLSENYISNIYYDNNTIHTTGNTGIFYVNSLDSITDVRIRNNIIFNASSNYYGWLCFWDGAGDIVNFTSSNNIIYNYPAGTAPYYRNGKSVTNFVSTDNITLNPLFKSNETFQLQSTSPAIDAGIDVGLTRDYYGFSLRGLPDIGAVEWGAGLGVKVGSQNVVHQGKLVLNNL